MSFVRYWDQEFEQSGMKIKNLKKWNTLLYRLNETIIINLNLTYNAIKFYVIFNRVYIKIIINLPAGTFDYNIIAKNDSATGNRVIVIYECQIVYHSTGIKEYKWVIYSLKLKFSIIKNYSMGTGGPPTWRKKVTCMAYYVITHRPFN